MSGGTTEEAAAQCRGMRAECDEGGPVRHAAERLLKVSERNQTHIKSIPEGEGKQAQVEDSVTHALLTEIISLPSPLPPF
ncbi:hypothetical protein ILYODFUR_008884 [Ilyodon furcidens]|uniref:Uncharacterized protein n=1 Tax=Ilyodon furcidens TaxID=33524 RepID=A0ABV0SVL4_9TELE